MIANQETSENHQKQQRDLHKLPQEDGTGKTKRAGLCAMITNELTKHKKKTILQIRGTLNLLPTCHVIIESSYILVVNAFK